MRLVHIVPGTVMANICVFMCVCVCVCVWFKFSLIYYSYAPVFMCVHVCVCVIYE